MKGKSLLIVALLCVSVLSGCASKEVEDSSIKENTNGTEIVKEDNKTSEMVEEVTDKEKGKDVKKETDEKETSKKETDEKETSKKETDEKEITKKEATKKEVVKETKDKSKESDIKSGKYSINVTLSGGSGRAKIESPTDLTVSNGNMTATIKWGSSNYTYMLVNGKKYYPVNSSGNSTFKIPVSKLDKKLSISAETIAMSEPHMVDYTLYFNSASMKSK